MLTMIESNALSLAQNTDYEMGDFYMVIFMSHPHTILGIMVAMISVIRLAI